MGDTIKFGKNVNLTKDDPLNMPRHKIYNKCIKFEECPLCFKCRAFDASDLDCRSCVLFDEGLLCNTEKHSVKILEQWFSMGEKEKINLDEKNI